ncbi:hypothetical protein MAR_030353, partial [Mya arenaria]
MLEKIEKAHQAELNKIKKEEIIDNVQLWALWQTEDEVDSGLSLIKTKTEKISALKAQLHFRKTIFEQKCDDKLVYRMSKTTGNRNILLTVEELTENVKN